MTTFCQADQIGALVERVLLSFEQPFRDERVDEQLHPLPRLGTRRRESSHGLRFSARKGHENRSTRAGKGPATVYGGRGAGEPPIEPNRFLEETGEFQP